MHFKVKAIYNRDNYYYAYIIKNFQNALNGPENLS